MSIISGLRCKNTQRITHQYPSEPDPGYKYRSKLEKKFQLGPYQPFPLHHNNEAVMHRLATFKYVYGNSERLRGALRDINHYLNRWEECIEEHKRIHNSNCNDPIFEGLITDAIRHMRGLHDQLTTYSDEDLQVFRHALRFTSLWNKLQNTILESFYANRLFYPPWYNTDHKGTENLQNKRSNCSECRLKNITLPPPVIIFALSGYFLPRALTLPDGELLPEGIHVRTSADESIVLHEHAHAYLHQQKNPTILHPNCEWVEEGLAGWASHSIILAESIAKSHLFELYDFWIVMNTLPVKQVRQLSYYWCKAPREFDWRGFVDGARECLHTHYKMNRHCSSWSCREQLEPDCQKLLFGEGKTGFVQFLQ